MTDIPNEPPATPEHQHPEWTTPATADTPPDGDTVLIGGEPPRRRSALHVGTIAAILVLLGGGVFAWRNIAGSGGGGSSPEGAARALFDAAANEDVLGVLSALLPGERDSFKEPIEDIRDELVRLGILSNDASLSGGIPGLDLRFEGLRFQTENLADGFAAVRVTAGTAYSRVDFSKLPLGRFIRDAAGSSLPSKPVEESSSAVEDDSSPMVAVRDGGRWYVSLWYSVAESARRDAGAPLPAFGRGVQAQGAASPEGAVRALVTALTKLSVRDAIALTPPDEMRALHDYASIFVNEAEKQAAKARQKVRITVRRLDLTSTRTGEQAVVKIEHAEFDVAATDGSFSFRFDGKCLTGKGLPFPGGRACPNELAQQGAFGFVRADIGFVTVQSGGQWFISPTRTMLGAVTATVRAMQPSDLETLQQLFESGFGFSASDSASTSQRVG